GQVDEDSARRQARDRPPPPVCLPARDPSASVRSVSSRQALSLTALTLGLLLSTGSPGEAKPQAVAVIPFPSPGNVTVARLVAVGGTSGGKRQPRVALATKGLPSRAY